MPALPLDEAGTYVAAAYLVFLALILVYVAIMASKLVRIARDLSELTALAERRRGGDDERTAGTDRAGERATGASGERASGEAVPR